MDAGDEATDKVGGAPQGAETAFIAEVWVPVFFEGPRGVYLVEALRVERADAVAAAIAYRRDHPDRGGPLLVARAELKIGKPRPARSSDQSGP